jgi:hypothetical protein
LIKSYAGQINGGREFYVTVRRRIAVFVFVVGIVADPEFILVPHHLLNGLCAENLPPQCVDQLIHLVDEVLHLILVVAAVGLWAECAYSVPVVAIVLWSRYSIPIWGLK